jgi:hypothetical protein
MAIILALLFFGLFLSRAVRRVTMLFGSLGGIYLAWDNFYTETIVGPDQIEVLRAEAVLLGDPAITVPAHVKLQIANHAKAELESVDLTVTLLDCPRQGSTKICEPVGQKTVRLQLLAPPGRARRTETWVYFDNVPSITGAIRAEVRITGGILDWS